MRAKVTSYATSYSRSVPNQVAVSSGIRTTVVEPLFATSGSIGLNTADSTPRVPGGDGHSPVVLDCRGPSV